MSTHPKKKICYICYRRFPDTNFEHYSQAASDNGYDVTILAILDEGQERFEEVRGRKVYRIQSSGSRKGRKSAFLFILKAVEFLKKYDFSIVHVHHSCNYFVLLKILCPKDAKFIFHSTSYPISVNHFQALRKMIAIFFQCLFMDSVIIQSEELKERLIGIRSLRKTKVVPVGFNRKILYPLGENEKRRLRKSLNIEENEPVLVYCGVISKLRQVDRLIKVFNRVHKTCQNAKLLMIGDGNTLMEVKALARYLQLEGSIIFAGRIPHDNVVNYIGVADIGISYIPINENYNYNPPLKTFEYLACGLPTIATRTESNRRIIRDGFNGVLVNDAPDDIADSIVSLLMDESKQMFLRMNARKSIMAFDFDHITKKSLLPLYQGLLYPKSNTVG